MFIVHCSSSTFFKESEIGIWRNCGRETLPCWTRLKGVEPWFPNPWQIHWWDGAPEQRWAHPWDRSTPQDCALLPYWTVTDFHLIIYKGTVSQDKNTKNRGLTIRPDHFMTRATFNLARQSRYGRHMSLLCSNTGYNILNQITNKSLHSIIMGIWSCSKTISTL